MFVMTMDDNVSDYGDFDEEDVKLLNLLSQAIENEPLIVTDIEDYEPPQGILLPIQTRLESEILRNIEGESNLSLRNRLIDQRLVDTTRRSQSREPTPPPTEPDTRSPIERFRKPPKKALSVTDLISPSWCELQYFYTLSKHGRKKRTPAMKQGSAIHQALEDEVHVTVPIETVTIEDSWGLRFWNICQGLRTLRETGRTRELEIWGTIGGELVNGVIDELSYDCPDPKHEEAVKAQGVPVVDLPEYQTSITEYLLAKPDRGENKGKAKQQDQWIYLTDVKTRATPTLPTGSSLRPTVVQLHLYHHMLENLVQGNFSLITLVNRYNLNPDQSFSDTFLAQLGNLNQEILSQRSTPPDDMGTLASSQDAMDILLQHNNLTTLWSYMISEFQQTFLRSDSQSSNLDSQNPSNFPASQISTSDLPPPPSQPTRLSPLLTACYMSSTYKHSPTSSQSRKTSTKNILGYKSFNFDAQFLHAYLTEALSWWRGEREAKGVALQEAWKCRSCDFRNECDWILERDQTTFDEAMKRRKMREVAGVQQEPEDIPTGTKRSKV